MAEGNEHGNQLKNTSLNLDTKQGLSEDADEFKDEDTSAADSCMDVSELDSPDITTTSLVFDTSVKLEMSGPGPSAKSNPIESNDGGVKRPLSGLKVLDKSEILKRSRVSSSVDASCESNGESSESSSCVSVNDPEGDGDNCLNEADDGFPRENLKRAKELLSQLRDELQKALADSLAHDAVIEEIRPVVKECIDLKSPMPDYVVSLVNDINGIVAASGYSKRPLINVKGGSRNSENASLDNDAKAPSDTNEENILLKSQQMKKRILSPIRKLLESDPRTTHALFREIFDHKENIDSNKEIPDREPHLESRSALSDDTSVNAVESPVRPEPENTINGDKSANERNGGIKANLSSEFDSQQHIPGYSLMDNLKIHYSMRMIDNIDKMPSMFDVFPHIPVPIRTAALFQRYVKVLRKGFEELFEDMAVVTDDLHDACDSLYENGPQEVLEILQRLDAHVDNIQTILKIQGNFRKSLIFIRCTRLECFIQKFQLEHTDFLSAQQAKFLEMFSLAAYLIREQEEQFWRESRYKRKIDCQDLSYRVENVERDLSEMDLERHM